VAKLSKIKVPSMSRIKGKKKKASFIDLEEPRDIEGLGEVLLLMPLIMLLILLL
jgi:hypothetical protein